MSISITDIDVFENVLTDRLASTAFQKIKDEAVWQHMMHRGGEVPRLICVMAIFEKDGSYPVYRHPADTLPHTNEMTAVVNEIRVELERFVGQRFNHVLIQYYRDGKDYISEHSDKTLDIMRGSRIVNLSLGATRGMRLREKKDERGSRGRETLDFLLDDNSLFCLGLEANKKWLHSIKQDKRPFKTKSTKERAFEGERISLTFRHIATFMTKSNSLIGQGARDETGDSGSLKNDALEMLKAFSQENHDSEFNWDKFYGRGFNSINCSEIQIDDLQIPQSD